MKTQKIIKQYLACLCMLGLMLSACNKGNQNFFYKDELFSVNITGYNSSTEELAAKLSGSTTIEQDMPPESKMQAFFLYPLKETDNTLKLTVKEKKSGKLVMEKELKREDYKGNISFFYKNGKVIPIPNLPAVEDGKVKLIYMFLPVVTNYTEPVDIVFGKYYFTPKVFEEVTRIKNAKAYEFSEPITFPTFSTDPQDYNGIKTSVSFLVRIYKAGTNIPYTQGTAYTLSSMSSILPKPWPSTPSSKLYMCEEELNGMQLSFFTRLEL